MSARYPWDLACAQHAACMSFEQAALAHSFHILLLHHGCKMPRLEIQESCQVEAVMAHHARSEMAWLRSLLCSTLLLAKPS